MPSGRNHLRRVLENIYGKINRPERIHPDPLVFVLPYDDPVDRELAGLIASSLAYGKISQIHRSLSRVFEVVGKPTVFLKQSSSVINSAFSGFVHRFTRGEELSCLILSLKSVLEQFGSLSKCFLSFCREEDETYLNALKGFVRVIRNRMPVKDKFLVPDPAKGSALKRLNLFLRWMIRSDAVDPGVWKNMSAGKLIIPLDVHMFRLSAGLGFTRRKTPGILAALEVTRCFRRIIPEDPVKFDFALTRWSIEQTSGFPDRAIEILRDYPLY